MTFLNKDFIIRLIFCIIAPFYFPFKWLKKRRFNFTNINKILVIAYNHGVGTYMLLTPMLKTLKINMPNCHISILLSSETVRQMAENSKFVDEIIYNQKLPSLKMFEGKEFFRQSIAPKKFDLAISTIYETSSKNAFWAFFSGAPYRVGFNQDINSFLDTFSFKRDAINTHEIQRYLNMLRCLGINYLSDELTLPEGGDAGHFVDIFLNRQKVSPKDIILGIHPGAKKNWPQKIWPLQRFIKVASRFSDKFKTKVIFFGGPDEDEIFLKLADSGDKFILANKQTICQTAALIKRCNIFLTNDSGLMHLAAAAKIPTVAIFGPTMETKNRPWNVPHIVVRKNLACSPCYNYEKLTCKQAKCLNMVSIDDVMSALTRLYQDEVLTKRKSFNIRLSDRRIKFADGHCPAIYRANTP
ncbi:MAG: glycosyltransferase family 9 protein [Candidatus Omnitrophota bacterium]